MLYAPGVHDLALNLLHSTPMAMYASRLPLPIPRFGLHPPLRGGTGGSGVDDVYHRSGFFAADHDEAQPVQGEVGGQFDRYSLHGEDHLD